MGKMKTGFFTATVGGEPIYEGYLLRGEPFVVKAQRYGEVWYRGLLGEEEYQNHLMDNPFEYAFRTYGERYVLHMREFSRRVIARANRDFGEENVKLVFRELPEEHVRLVLGLPEEESEGTGEDDGSVVEFLNRLGSGKAWVGEEAQALLKEVRTESPDFLKVFVYPHYLAFVGSIGSERFVALTSKLESVDLLGEWGSSEGMEDEPDRFNLETFAGLGVPFARVRVKEDGTVSFRIYRRIGMLIKTEVDVPLSLEQVKRVVREYRAWIRSVKTEVQSHRPPHITLPAWKKMIMAYLDEYPNPEDFARILTVEAGISIEVPTVKVEPGGSHGFDHSGPDSTFTTLE